MVGDPADAILADYYAFGARNFDARRALADMVARGDRRRATSGRGSSYLQRLGYLPVDGSYGCCNYYGPVSTTLEYDTADFAISALAGDLGEPGLTARRSPDRAQDWRNLLNPASGFVQPRDADGALGGRLPARRAHRLRRGRLVDLHRDGALRPGGPGRGQGRRRRDGRLPGHRAEQLHRRPRLCRPRQRAEHRAALGVRLHRRALRDPGDGPPDPGPALDATLPAASATATTTSAR